MKEEYVLDKKGNPLKDTYFPKSGEIIDRYGPPYGLYTSPVKNGEPYSYDQRSLPYVEDVSEYHQYRIVGDFKNIENYIEKCTDKTIRDRITTYMESYDLSYDDLKVKSGKIASGFRSTGGGIQYELPMPLYLLEAIGILKEIK